MVLLELLVPLAQKVIPERLGLQEQQELKGLLGRQELKEMLDRLAGMVKSLPSLVQ
jgi:hypothetical protein